ncbi:MAG: hypothetical protein H6679_04985 [Epsilonproteobacteria bacterium]|nr:hypothetical protein [Campylobacterota bacterium]
MNKKILLLILLLIIPTSASPWLEHINATLATARTLSHTLTAQQQLSQAKTATPEQLASCEVASVLLTLAHDLTTLVSTCASDGIVENGYDAATQLALMLSNIGTAASSLDRALDLQLMPDEDKDCLEPSALRTTLTDDALAQTTYLYLAPTIELVSTLAHLYTHTTSLNAAQQKAVRQCARACALLCRLVQTMLIQSPYSKEKGICLVLVLCQCMRVAYTASQTLEVT